jgi:hypothetical protein
MKKKYLDNEPYLSKEVSIFMEGYKLITENDVEISPSRSYESATQFLLEKIDQNVSSRGLIERIERNQSIIIDINLFLKCKNIYRIISVFVENPDVTREMVRTFLQEISLVEPEMLKNISKSPTFVNMLSGILDVTQVEEDFVIPEDIEQSKRILKNDLENINGDMLDFIQTTEEFIVGHINLEKIVKKIYRYCYFLLKAFLKTKSQMDKYELYDKMKLTSNKHKFRFFYYTYQCSRKRSLKSTLIFSRILLNVLMQKDERIKSIYTIDKYSPMLYKYDIESIERRTRMDRDRERMRRAGQYQVNRDPFETVSHITAAVSHPGNIVFAFFG